MTAKEPRMIQRSGRHIYGLLIAVVTLAILPSPAASQEAPKVYVTVDKSNVVSLPAEQFTKVSVANPNIADVVVISPTQILINGKTAGTTSLVLFYPRRLQYFDLVVQPAPLASVKTPASPGDAHPILVQRGDKVTSHLFVRDDEQAWLELGAPKAETEAGKK
jgi:hypothetical protein